MIRIVYFLIFSFLFSTQSVYASFNVEASWNLTKGKVITLTCDEESPRVCLSVCDSETMCEVPEGLCYNCIGNDLFIVNFYKNLGLIVNGSGINLRSSVLEDTLLIGKFITLKANSVYNIISDYDSKSMKRKFQNLCPELTIKDPVVFAKVNRDRKPVGLLFVVCDSEVFEMTYDYSSYSTSSNLY